ncbi:MAG: Osmosensitive channel histidine kinase KdpD [Myxococcales bacterium]|nr:Osmosensitive channel histidine kinase KdpD [Myxococcales bacterium]
MEARAVIRKASSRAVYAAGLLAVALAALLVAWFISGWAEVRARQRAVSQAPAVAAEQRAGELSRELRSQLAVLMSREVQRPYYVYQNLFHDPQAPTEWGLTPSPLATTPEDPLVLGYFQLDADARATIPTINDKRPELSDAQHLAENRAFRAEVARSLAVALAPPRAGPIVALAAPRPAQVLNVDRNTYAQNAVGNAGYWDSPEPQLGKPVLPGHKPAPPVTITISPLEWRTLPFGSAPALLAVRQVQTPDGALAQGFVVDRATLTSWLAARAGDMVAELRTGEGSAQEIAPGWFLSVAPNPRAIVQATHDAASVARAFLIRFVGLGVVAVLAASLVVLLVMRAERLARERSQFAAAAAHELRTPLAGLQLYGDMLADGLGDPAKARDYARRMSEEAARLGRVVSNVLGFSQLERGNLSVDVQVGVLGEALRELAALAEPALDRAGAALDVEVEPEVRARFDRDALARIVGNLLDNAEKYARAAEDRTITLTTRDLGDIVEVVVADRGPGVAVEKDLFRPFARGVSADGPAGLGLGLALSQSLARAMGGDLVYRPTRGRGATFALRLPRA